MLWLARLMIFFAGVLLIASVIAVYLLGVAYLVLEVLMTALTNRQ